MKEISDADIIEYFKDNPRSQVIDPKSAKIIPANMSRWLEGLFEFYKIEEFDKLLIYDEESGAYINHAESRIKKILEEYFKDAINSYLVTETIQHIKRMSTQPLKNLDRYHNLINFKNGVYNIDTQKFISHDEEYMFSYCLPFEYNKEAKCDKILTFLSSLTSKNEDFITLLESLAYIFVPKYPIRKAFMLVGEGRNGKSTFLSLIEKLLGRDLISFEKLDVLCRDANYISNIAGKFANTGFDLPKKGLPDVANFKSLTTYDYVSGHKKYVQEAFEFQSRAKLFFATNQIPQVDEDTDAFFSRWVIIKFEKQFEDNPKILEQISNNEELAGLFNLLIPIIKKLQEQYKFTFAESIDQTRTTYLKSASPIKLFAEDMLEIGEGEAKSIIYSAYTDYCEKYNLTTKNEVWFWKELKHYVQFNVIQEGREKVRFAKGITLKSNDNDNQEDTKQDKTPNTADFNAYCESLGEVGNIIKEYLIVPENKEIAQEIKKEPGPKEIKINENVYCPKCAKPVSALYETGYGLICVDCLNTAQRSVDDLTF